MLSRIRHAQPHHLLNYETCRRHCCQDTSEQQLLLLSAEIRVITSALKLTAYLVQEMKKDKGWELDARLLGYAWGLQHSQAWNVVQS